MYKKLSVLVLTFGGLFASPLDICKSFTIEKSTKGIEGIDAIYVINLDERFEKLQKSQAQMASFDLNFKRFSAVEGKNLSPSEINKACLLFKKGMQESRWAQNLNNDQNRYVFLNQNVYDKPVSSVFFKKGALGCTLSHLSIIKNAYEQNISRIWILEDDFKIIQNPKILSHLISKLNQTVGKEAWDILYTDFDTYDAPIYFEKNTFIDPVKGLDLAWFWRPDIDLNPEKIFFRQKVNEDFVRVGSRMRTHSYILNRSGIEKLYRFYQNHGAFCPIDHEMFLIDDFNAYTLSYNVVSFEETTSDTRGNP